MLPSPAPCPEASQPWHQSVEPHSASTSAAEDSRQRQEKAGLLQKAHLDQIDAGQPESETPEAAGHVGVDRTAKRPRHDIEISWKTAAQNRASLVQPQQPQRVATAETMERKKLQEGIEAAGMG